MTQKLMSGEEFRDYPKEEAGVKSHTGLDWTAQRPSEPSVPSLATAELEYKEQQIKAGCSQIPFQPSPAPFSSHRCGSCSKGVEVRTEGGSKWEQVRSGPKMQHLSPA